MWIVSADGRAARFCYRSEFPLHSHGLTKTIHLVLQDRAGAAMVTGLKRNRFWSFAAVFLLISACQPSECLETVDADFSLEYTQYGGWIERATLIINEDGSVEGRFLSYSSFDSISTYKVRDSLSTLEKSEWGDRLNEIDFFCLEDDYTKKSPIPDDDKYEISVVSGGVHKTVNVIPGGNYPADLISDLLILFNDLYRDVFLPIRDSASVGTVILARDFIIREWPFSAELPLSGLEAGVSLTSGTIRAYLDSLYHPGPEHADLERNYLYLEGDSLYRVSVGTIYFSVREVLWAEAWPSGLDRLPSEIPVGGIVIRNDQFRELRSVLQGPDYGNYPVFTLIPPSENVVAYELWLLVREPLD